MNKYRNFIMGPAPTPAAGAPRFWNMASVSDDEGEITLYGDVMSQQPVDWWTGEPEPGLYITPEGFMEDLAAVKDKARITVKINSGGGDLYTGIAIHNALKALVGEVNVVVEGIAASAASVIMCAGDTVTVFPGSMIMIHGVSVMLWAQLNIRDMKQLIKGMDASERAVAAIYNSKTGIETDTLRNMMEKETWMTGAEAIEKGFADNLIDGSVTASLSADKRVLFVNGINFNAEGLRHIPASIPVAPQAMQITNKAIPATPVANKNKTANAATKGEKPMTLEELMEQEPDLVAQIQTTAVDSQAQAQAAAVQAAVAAERQRLADIDSVAAAIPDPSLVQAAKYGENPCTAQELCFQAARRSAADGTAFLAAYRADGRASGTAQVSAVPAASLNGNSDAEDIQAVVNAYNKIKGGAD